MKLIITSMNSIFNNIFQHHVPPFLCLRRVVLSTMDNFSLPKKTEANRHNLGTAAAMMIYSRQLTHASAQKGDYARFVVLLMVRYLFTYGCTVAHHVRFAPAHWKWIVRG